MKKNKLGKEDIVRILAKRLDSRQCDISAVLDEFVKLFNEVMLSKGEIKLQMFGKLTMKKYKAPCWRDVLTGKVMRGEPKYRIVYTPSKVLKHLVDDIPLTTEELEELKKDGETRNR